MRTALKAILLPLLLPAALLWLRAGPWPDLAPWLWIGALLLTPLWIGLAWAPHWPWTRWLEPAIRWGVAGFCLTLGAMSIRNEGPLDQRWAVAAIIYGLAVLAAGWLGRGRLSLG